MTLLPPGWGWGGVSNGRKLLHSSGPVGKVLMVGAWALELSFLASISNLDVMSKIYVTPALRELEGWADLLSANTS